VGWLPLTLFDRIRRTSCVESNIESSDDAIASGTLDGIIVNWNTGAQKIYGYTEAEAVSDLLTVRFVCTLGRSR